MQDIIVIDDVPYEVEATISSGPEEISRGGDTGSDNKLGTLIGSLLESVSAPLSSTLKSVNVQKVDLSFGIKAGGKGSFIIASSSAEVHVNVSLSMVKKENA